MKLKVMLLALMVALLSISPADAQLLEMAANCDAALKTLSEIIKAPDAKSVQKIKERLGVDSLNECDTPDGKITCFQCLDDNRELRLIQVLRKASDGALESLGYGCRCASGK